MSDAPMPRRRRFRLLPMLLMLLVATCLGPGANPLSSGPMVQRVGATTAHILVHTAASCELTLAFSSAGREEVELNERGARRRHVFVLQGLEPATRVRYSVREWAEPQALVGRGAFRTAPQPGQGSVRFAAFGDSGRNPWWNTVVDRVGLGVRDWVKTILPGRGAQWDVAREVERVAPDLVLHLGDVVYPDGGFRRYPEAFLLPFARLLADVPIYPTLGNHDLLTGFGAPYLYVFDLPGSDGPSRGRYYDFVHGPVQFVCLDSFSTSLESGTAQRKWLDDVLSRSTTPWRVVFTHRPFETVSRSRADAANQWLRDHIHPLLVRHKVALVLSGHDHVYERFQKRDGVTYVVAGGGGKSLYALGTQPSLEVGERRYSFVLAEANAHELRLRTLAANGEELDALVLRR